MPRDTYEPVSSNKTVANSMFMGNCVSKLCLKAPAESDAEKDVSDVESEQSGPHTTYVLHSVDSLMKDLEPGTVIYENKTREL